MSIWHKVSKILRNPALALGLFLFLAAVHSLYIRSEKQVDSAFQQRERSFALANELHETSDGLTRMARSYVVTGEARYKQYYQDILDIREGKKPRQLYHWWTYEDLTTSDGPALLPASQKAVPLLVLMRQASFSAGEFATLDEAMKNSDALAAREMAAMELAESTGPDAGANRAKALEMLYDEAYRQTEADMMRPIGEFFSLVDERTDDEIRSARNHATFVRYAFILLGLMLLLLIVRNYNAFRNVMGGSLKDVEAHIARLGRGEFSSPVSGKRAPKGSLLGLLSETQIQLREMERIRDRASAALGASEIRYRRLFESAKDGILILDFETGEVVDVNPFLVNLLGIPREEFIRSKIYDLGPFKDTIANTAKFAELQENEYIRYEDLPLETDDGRTIDVEFISNAYDANGTKVIQCNIRDVSARKKAEEKIRALTANLENLVAERTLALRNFKAALDEHNIVSITDVNGKLGYVNDAFCGLSKYSHDELIGQNPNILNSGHQPKAFYEELWGAIQVGRVWKGEFRNRAKDGSYYWISATIVPFLNEDGKPHQYIAIGTDVTDRKAAETALERAKAEADTANQAKSKFLANMSHEIRTPMNGVIGAVDVLRQTSLRPHQIEMVEIVGESANSLLRVIDDILDFSKIEADKIELESEPLSLADLLETVCDSLNPLAVRKNVDLTYFIDPNIPDLILSDSVRLRQILNNLIGNAIKFSARTERSGQVNARVDREGDAAVRVTVSDNGVGMEPAALDKLFQPFSQADTSTTRNFGGTGLGLSICKRLVELLGGTISAQSVPDQGAVFTVILPLVVVPDSGGLPTSHDLTGLDCIITGQDDETAADWRAYLESAGARVWQTDDLPEAAGLVADSDAAQVSVIITNGREPLDLVALRANFATSRDDARHVIITRNGHRWPHEEAPGVVALDGNNMPGKKLLHAVAISAGRADPIDHDELADGTVKCASPDIEEAAKQGRLILVAEDNEINQKVIWHQLAAMGFACEIVADGLEALEHWRTGRYALVLSDLHMPKLDGHELAAKIRSEEVAGTRIPIIAFTANITRGERERCREAGMDDYLSKPAQLDAFRAMLGKWMSATPKAEPAVPSADQTATETNEALPVLDTSVLAQLVGSDPALIARLLTSYMDSAKKAAEEIRAAAALNNWAAAGAVGHRLKSSSRAVGALALGECCAKLEIAGNTNNEISGRELMFAFERELAGVFEKIKSELGS